MEPESLNLQETLPNPRVSNSKLLDDLQWWTDNNGDAERSKLLSKKPVRDAVANRIQQACEECLSTLAGGDGGAAARDELLLQQLAALDRLLALIPAETGTHLAQHLLAGSSLLKSVATALDCILQLAHEYDAAPAIEGDENDVAAAVSYTGRGLMGMLMDMANYTCPVTVAQTSQLPAAAGSQRAAQSEVTGRDLMGPALMKPLLALTNMDSSLRAAYYNLRRAAAALLVELVTYSKRNQRLLLSPAHVQAYCTLMGQVLRECGDQLTQIDLFEVMYRCAKGGLGEMTYQQHVDAQIRGLLAQLLAKDAADLDLKAELPDLVAAYNKSLGQHASVMSVEAFMMKVSCAGIMFPSGKQVAMGPSHITLPITLDLNQAGNPDELEDEVLDINYSNISRIITGPGSAAQHRAFAGTSVLEIQCKVFPACLGQDVAAAAEALGPSSSGAPFSLGLVLQQEQLDIMLRVLESKDLDIRKLSPSAQEPSQPDRQPRKMSMGNMPQSYHKQPLSLSKSTPTTATRPKPPLPLSKVTPISNSAPSGTGAAAAAADGSMDGRPLTDQQHQQTTEKSRLSASTPLHGGAAAAAEDSAPTAAAAPVITVGASSLVATTPTAGAAPIIAAATAATAVVAPAATLAAESPAEEPQQQQPMTDSQMFAELERVADTAELAGRGRGGGRIGRPSLDSIEAAAAAGTGAAPAAEGIDWPRGAAATAAADAAGHHTDDNELQHDTHDHEEQQQRADGQAAAAKRQQMQQAAKNKGKAAAAAAKKPPAAPKGKAPTKLKGPAVHTRKGKAATAAAKRAAAGQQFTQDSIEDPDIPSRQPTATAPSARNSTAAARRAINAAAGTGTADDMPGWMNAAPAAAAGGAAAVTTPVGSRTAAAAAEQQDLALSVDPPSPAPSPPPSPAPTPGVRVAAAEHGTSAAAAAATTAALVRPAAGSKLTSATNKGSRLSRMIATSRGQAAAAAADEAKQAMSDTFPDGNELDDRGDEAQQQQQRADKAAETRARGRPKKPAGAAADKGVQPQHSPQVMGSNFEFDLDDDAAHDSSDESYGAATKAGKGAKGNRGKGTAAAKGKAAITAAARGRARAAGKPPVVGHKRKAEQKQRKAPAAAAAADEYVGSSETECEDASRIAARAKRAAGGGDAEKDMAASDEGQADSQQDAAAAGGGRQGKPTDKAAAGGRPQRAAKGKAMQAMQHQLRDSTQQALSLSPGDPDAATAPAAAAAAKDAGGRKAVGLRLGCKTAAAAAADGGGEGPEFGGDDDGLSLIDDQQQLEQQFGATTLGGEPQEGGSDDEEGFEQQLARLAAGQRTTAPPSTGIGLGAADVTPETMKVTTARIAKRLALTSAADGGKQRPATSAAAVAAAATGATATALGVAAAAAAPRVRQLPTLSFGKAIGAAAKPQSAAAIASGERLELSGLADLAGLGLGGSRHLPLGGSGTASAAVDGRGSKGGKGSRTAAARKELGLLNDDGDDNMNDGRGAATADQSWGGLVGSQEDEGDAGDAGAGTDMMRMLQMVTTAMKGDDDIEDSEEDAELEMVKTILMQAMHKKQAQAKQKQAAMIQEVQDVIAGRLEELQANMQQELSRLATAGKERVTSIHSSLAQQMEEITIIKDRYDQEISAAWQSYRDMYQQLATVEKEVRTGADKKQASYKRQLSALQQEAAQLLSTAQAKLARSAKRPRMTPDLAMMLQALS